MNVPVSEYARVVLLNAIKAGGRGAQADIADRAGVSRSALNDFIKNRKYGSDEFRAKIAAALGMRYEDMLALGRTILEGGDPAQFRYRGGAAVSQPYSHLAEESPAPITGSVAGVLPSFDANLTGGPAIIRRVPLISWVRAGKWTESDDSFQPSDAADWIAITCNNVGETAFALQVRGDSMEPEFHEKDTIIVDPARQAENGQFVVAKNGDDEATFKRFVKESGRIFLAPLNSRYPVIDVTEHDIRIVGVVVEKVRRKRYV